MPSVFRNVGGKREILFLQTIHIKKQPTKRDLGLHVPNPFCISPINPDYSSPLFFSTSSLNNPYTKGEIMKSKQLKPYFYTHRIVSRPAAPTRHKRVSQILHLHSSFPLLNPSQCSSKLTCLYLCFCRLHNSENTQGMLKANLLGLLVDYQESFEEIIQSLHYSVSFNRSWCNKKILNCNITQQEKKK